MQGHDRFAKELEIEIVIIRITYWIKGKKIFAHSHAKSWTARPDSQ